ncbi:MAG: hypothetical protein HY238_15150 [Acidobacteria bacterium]|nr:hypothetical protein [Acidobacteriota bacterium]
MQLQYIGFEQMKDIREYIFHGIAHGEETKVFRVITDLELFRRNHVGMQEGPALCLRILTIDLETPASPQRPALRHALTDEDMLAYLLHRGLPTTKKQNSKTRIPTKAPVSS